MARLSPYKPAGTLSDAELDVLHAAVVDTLRAAVARSAGLEASGLKAEKKLGLRVHGRAGQPLPGLR